MNDTFAFAALTDLIFRQKNSAVAVWLAIHAPCFRYIVSGAADSTKEQLPWTCPIRRCASTVWKRSVGKNFKDGQDSTSTTEVEGKARLDKALTLPHMAGSGGSFNIFILASEQESYMSYSASNV